MSIPSAPNAFAPNQNEFRYVFFAPPEKFDATVAFYRDELALPYKGGFGDAGGPMQGAYLQAGQGVIEIITDRVGSELKDTVLAAGEQYQPPSGAYLLIEVDDVEQAHAHAAGQGVAIHQPLVSWPWGFRDFKVKDPCGTMICLFSRLA